MAANYSIVIMGSETVIYDVYGNKAIRCPTEKEVVEYINENKKEITKSIRFE